MKITNSNKTQKTVTIKGDASEMALLLDLAEKMAQQKYDTTSGIEQQTYADCVDKYSELLETINSGGLFS